MKRFLFLIIVTFFVTGILGCDESDEDDNTNLILALLLGASNGSIPIARDELKKQLPDVVYNSVDNNYFAFWVAGLNLAGTTENFYIRGRKISNTGSLQGDPVTLSTSTSITLMARAVFMPDMNQYFVIYSLRTNNQFNLYGVIIDADGNPVGSTFRITNVAASQFHYTLAYNSTNKEVFITYNDSRNGADNGDVFGVIYSNSGTVAEAEFTICGASGRQYNPVVSWNSTDNTYLINWEDFRTVSEWFDQSDIMGALLNENGGVTVADIAMCVDGSGTDGDQRFNHISYDSVNNQWLVLWSVNESPLQNAGIRGGIVSSAGSMGTVYTLVDTSGAQMIAHSHYMAGESRYFISMEHDDNNLQEQYFRDINASLDVRARYIDADLSSNDSSTALVDIYSGSGNQRFVRFAHNSTDNNFLLIWQEDFPGQSQDEMGHMMTAGGDISGKIYTVP